VSERSVITANSILHPLVFVNPFMGTFNFMFRYGILSFKLCLQYVIQILNYRRKTLTRKNEAWYESRVSARSESAARRAGEDK
jgi:hypothetical protein